MVVDREGAEAVRRPLCGKELRTLTPPQTSAPIPEVGCSRALLFALKVDVHGNLQWRRPCWK